MSESNFYILTGEPFLIEQKLKEFKNKFVHDDGFEIFNYQKIDLNEKSFEDLMQSILSPPLGAGNKMVIVKNCPLDKETIKKNAVFFTQIEKLISKKDLFLKIFFIFPGIKISQIENLPLIEMAKKTSSIIELESFSQKNKDDLTLLISKKIHESGKRISQETLEKILEYGHFDLTGLFKEIEKLLIYAGNEHEITIQMVEEIFSESSKKIYNFFDFIIEKKAEKAISSFRNLLKEGVSPGFILSFLTKKYHLFLKIKSFLKEGKTRNFIINKLTSEEKLFYGTASKSLNQASFYTPESLIRAISLCHALDLAIKTGQEDPEISFEVLITNLISLKK